MANIKKIIPHYFIVIFSDSGIREDRAELGSALPIRRIIAID
jgi:hypothetical protein